MATSWMAGTGQSRVFRSVQGCRRSCLKSVHARAMYARPWFGMLPKVRCACMQLNANDVDTTLAVGALNNIIANNNLTAEFGSINTNELHANSTQAALNETLGPIKLYPLRVAAGVTAECTQSYLTPATYYALETAYSGTASNKAPWISVHDTCGYMGDSFAVLALAALQK